MCLGGWGQYLEQKVDDQRSEGDLVPLAYCQYNEGGQFSWSRESGGGE